MRISWIGAQGASEAAVLETLGLEAMPDTNPGQWSDAEYSVRTFSNGWVVIVGWDSLNLETDLPLVAEATPGLVVGCHATTVVMYSEVRAYQDGKPLWSAVHDPDEDADDLAVTGEPPARLDELLAAAKDQQNGRDEVDFIFDVPIDLAAHLTGFHPNEDAHRDWIALRRRRAVSMKSAGGSEGASSEGPLAALLRVFGLKR